MKSLEQTKKNSNLIYDVGMHKGEDTSYYLKKGYNLIAFEADPNLVAECRLKFAAEIKSEQLTIVEGAIIDFSSVNQTSTSVKFFKNQDVSVWGTVANEWARRNENLGTSNEIIEVPTINFKDCLKKYGIPYYLKIDIEGMDLICLRTLMDFEEKPDYVSIESEKISFEKLKEEFEIFKALGYTKFKAINQANITSQKLLRPTRQGKQVDHNFIEGSSGSFGTDLPKKWKTEKELLKEYRRIFLGYKLFGDFGRMQHTYLGSHLLSFINKLSPSPVPGWYDTHAKHSSVID